MSQDYTYIRDYYKVPASYGQRVEYTSWDNKPAKRGRIVGACGHRLQIHFDGDVNVYPGIFHATDGLRYLPPDEPAIAKFVPGEFKLGDNHVIIIGGH